jgi:hypothetical protein
MVIFREFMIVVILHNRKMDFSWLLWSLHIMMYCSRNFRGHAASKIEHRIIVALAYAELFNYFPSKFNTLISNYNPNFDSDKTQGVGIIHVYFLFFQDLNS